MNRSSWPLQSYTERRPDDGRQGGEADVPGQEDRETLQIELLRQDPRPGVSLPAQYRATIMAESGVPITALQRIAGHGSIEVTARFCLKVQPELHEATLNALSAMD